jgi:cytochrome c-type biogenesis protein CcmF
MITEIGHFALILALVIALIQSIVPVWGARIGDTAMMQAGSYAALTQFALVGIAFAVLTQAYILSDFSVLNVAENSHSDKPMIYKISGVWGNHEGSMLLWVLILALFGAAVAAFGNNLPQVLKANVVGVQGWVSLAFLLFILATSNPFTRLFPAPIEGNDLNPLLQDIGLAIHPPLLYLGYVGLSIAFAFAVAALIEGRIDAAWARWVRPWTLAAWVFLTAGIAMGSYWAYYELGWGGWWFWDPVENASFMPWLAATALLHSAIVMEKREALKIWTILLAILAFSLSLLGAFLVRSGVLTSVHAFAVDPERGVFLLAILMLFIGGSLALFAWRGSQLQAGGLFAPISREGALVFNNLILTASTAAVFIGTLYPLALESITGEKISVGEPFFNLTFGPIIIPLLIAVPFGPLLAWKRGDLYAAAQRLMLAFAGALLVVLLVLGFTQDGPILAALGIGLAVWLMLGAITDPLSRAKFGSLPIKTSFARLFGLPRSSWGTAFAHFGVGVTTLGIVAVTAFESERILIMQQGDVTEIGGYSVTYEGSRDVQGPNYQDLVSTFTIRKGGVVQTVLEPAKRFYPARNMPTTEAAIETFGIHQIYISPGDQQQDGGLVVRLYDKPLVTLIWIGCIFMMIGGTISLADRRLRIGAPRRSEALRNKNKTVEGKA